MTCDYDAGCQGSAYAKKIGFTFQIHSVQNRSEGTWSAAAADAQLLQFLNRSCAWATATLQKTVGIKRINTAAAANGGGGGGWWVAAYCIAALCPVLARSLGRAAGRGRGGRRLQRRGWRPAGGAARECSRAGAAHTGTDTGTDLQGCGKRQCSTRHVEDVGLGEVRAPAAASHDAAEALKQKVEGLKQKGFKV